MKIGKIAFVDANSQVGIIRGPQKTDTVFFTHTALRNLKFEDLEVGTQVGYLDEEQDGLLHATAVAQPEEHVAVETAMENAVARGWKSGTVLIIMLKVGLIKPDDVISEVNVRFGADVVNPPSAFSTMKTGTPVWYTDKQGPDGQTRIATAVELKSPTA